MDIVLKWFYSFSFSLIVISVNLCPGGFELKYLCLLHFLQCSQNNDPPLSALLLWSSSGFTVCDWKWLFQKQYALLFEYIWKYFRESLKIPTYQICWNASALNSWSCVPVGLFSCMICQLEVQQYALDPCHKMHVKLSALWQTNTELSKEEIHVKQLCFRKDKVGREWFNICHNKQMRGSRAKSKGINTDWRWDTGVEQRR